MTVIELGNFGKFPQFLGTRKISSKQVRLGNLQFGNNMKAWGIFGDNIPKVS